MVKLIKKPKVILFLLTIGIFSAVVFYYSQDTKQIEPVQAQEGNVYYVSSLGDDTNPGTQALPWKTINKVNNYPGGFQPGDSILFKRGETWREQLIVPSSGSAGLPITFSAYGTGEKPIINGADLATGWARYLATNVYNKTFTSPPKVVVEDGVLLTYVDWDNNISTTIDNMSAGTFTADEVNNISYVWSTDNADPDTHTMEVSAKTSINKSYYPILIEDRDYVTLENLDITQGTNSNIHFAIWGGADISNIIINNCTSRYSGGQGIELFGTADPPNNISDCLIDNNNIYYNRQHGIAAFYNTKDITISNNTIHHNGWGAINDSTGGHGISSWSYDAVPLRYPSGLIVEYNEVYNNFIATDGFAGTGIQADDRTNDSIYRYNNVYDNEGSGLVDNGKGVNSWYGNVVYRNGLSGGWGHSSGIILLNPESSGTTVYNNIFYQNYYGIYLWASVEGIIIKNNIISNSIIKEIGSGVLATTGHDIDYNYYYHPTGGTFMNWGGTNYSYDDWLTNSSQDGNSTNLNPLFTNVSANDFTLQSTSPAIDAGVDVGITLDYLGNIVPQGLAPDIGAYEYQEAEFCPPLDLDCSGAVTLDDLTQLKTLWGQSGKADLNQDNITNVSDFAIMMSTWSN